MFAGRPQEIDRVFVIRNPDHQPASLHRRLVRLLEDMDARQRLPPAGSRVLVKPFLDPDCSPFARWSTHPHLLRSLIGWLRQNRLQVLIGDVRSCLPGTPVAGFDWLQGLAADTGATLVDFASAGVRRLPARSWLHRDYPVSRAALDVDAVINLANAQPHRRFVLSGAVKNLFNVVVGDCQAWLEQVYLCPQRDVARVIADVCAQVHPALSLLDLTSMPVFDAPQPVPVGVLLAGCGPASVDALAARIIGWDAETIHTTRQAVRLGLGTDDPRRLQVEGLSTHLLPLVPLPLPPPLTYPAWPQRLLRLLQRRLDRPQLRIDEQSCCGERHCRCVCGREAILRLANGGSAIDPQACIDCGLCQSLCPQAAIRRVPVGFGRWLRRLRDGSSLQSPRCMAVRPQRGSHHGG